MKKVGSLSLCLCLSLSLSLSLPILYFANIQEWNLRPNMGEQVLCTRRYSINVTVPDENWILQMTVLSGAGLNF